MLGSQPPFSFSENDIVRLVGLGSFHAGALDVMLYAGTGLAAPATSPIAYPETPWGDVVEMLLGEKVADP